jgi:hypothetical protein
LGAENKEQQLNQLLQDSGCASINIAIPKEWISWPRIYMLAWRRNIRRTRWRKPLRIGMPISFIPIVFHIKCNTALGASASFSECGGS